MPPTRARIQELERATRFLPQWLEKALRLQEVLVALQGDRRTQGRLALKGGTALNLAYLGLARLSVDLDFNYVGAIDKEAAIAERPSLEQQVERTVAGLAYGVRRIRDSYASTTWALHYATVFGGPDALRLDINYLHRVPLFGTRELRTSPLGDEPSIALVCVSPEELMGGKIMALVERGAARDLFDAYRFARSPIRELDAKNFRIGFLVLLATLPTEVRALEARSVLDAVTEGDVRTNLAPMLRRDEPVDRNAMVVVVEPMLKGLLAWSTGERAFVDAVTVGRIEPEHLTGDDDLQAKIRNHPALRWKVENVSGYLKGDRPPEGRRRGRPRRH